MKKHLFVCLLLSMSTIPTVCGRRSLFEKMEEIQQTMERLQTEIFDSFHTDLMEEFDAFTIRNKHAISIDHTQQRNGLSVTLDAITIDQEKPDAQVDIDHIKKRVTLEITTPEETIKIQAHNKLLSFDFIQKHEQKKEGSENILHTVNRYSQTQTIAEKLDLSQMPEIAYDKANKKLTITFAIMQPKDKAVNIPIKVQ